MPRRLSSLNEFAVKLNTAGKGFAAKLEKAIAEAVVKVHADAVVEFGTYQPDIGPFKAWQLLEPTTLKQKYRAGAGQDDPLIGHYAGSRKNQIYPVALRQALQMEIRGLEGVVGTNDPLGKWHEFGTIHIPPRPFLRPALYKNRDWIRARLKAAIIEALRTM